MPCTDQEVQFATWLERIELSLHRALAYVDGQPSITYFLRFEGRFYALNGKKTFSSIDELKSAFDKQMPIFRFHAAFAHFMMLRYFDRPSERAQFDEWISLQASADQEPMSIEPEKSPTDSKLKALASHLLTSVTEGRMSEDAYPEWTLDNAAAARFDPARPTLYFRAYRELLDSGEPLWLSERMPTTTTETSAPRL